MKAVIALLLALAAATSFAADELPAGALREEMAQHWQSALAIYRKELAAHPRRVDLWLRMADIYATLKQPAEAARAVAEAARLRPNDAALQSRLSQTYAMSGDSASALAAIRRAIALRPGSIEYQRAQAELAAWAGDLALAAASHRAILALAPDDAQARLQLARLQVRTGHLDQAVSTLQTHLRQHADDHAARLELADVETYRGNYAAAQRLLTQYHQSAGDTEAYRRHQSNLLARSARPHAALFALRPLLQKYPQDYELHLLQTLALNTGRHNRAASAELGVLQQLGPQRPETRGAALQVNTPRRPFFGGGADYYSDSIPLSVLHTYLKGALGWVGGTRVSLEAHRWNLRTGSGSGYETPATTRNLQSSVQDFWVLAEMRPRPELALTAGAGAATYADAPGRLLGQIGLNYAASDTLSLSLQHQRQPVPVSPKAAALGIARNENRLGLNWRPGYATTVELHLARDRYSDGNWRDQLDLAPRWAMLRSERHNLDLGLNAQLLRYDHSSSNGYYAPTDFQRYWAMAYYYCKGGDNRGLSLVAGAGPERDSPLDDSFRFGGNLYAEGIVGVYQDWQLRTYGGYGSRLDSANYQSGTPHGYSVGFELIRRF